MNLTNTIKIAVQAIFTNKLRSFLTTLGVVIGVASVVLLIAIGNGLQVFITGQFESLGANTINVVPGDPFGEGGGFGNRDSQLSAFSSVKIKYSDVSDIRRLGYPISKVAPLAQSSAKTSFRQEEATTTIVGTEPEYQQILNSEIDSGRFFDNQENNKKSRVAVIGPDIAEEIFGQVDPIGKKIKVNSQTFSVIGVTKAKGGSFGGPSFDSYVIIPLQTYFSLFDSNQILQIAIQIESAEQIDQGIEKVENLLLKRLEDDEFSVFETKQILEIINQILSTLTLGLGGIAAISLVVGGIGIMNIMLVSVTERTREIGLRKALGATPNTILTQFLVEAILLSLLGGFIGIVIAYLLSIIINNFFPAQISLDAVILAFSVSSAIGIIFGVAPARSASKLSPIEALRYE